MSSQFQKFKSLHEMDELFVLPNVWDARSAIVFQDKKFPAMGTSSAAVANCLGYEDGENIPFEDYLFVIKRILSSVRIPLTVDLEMGYGDTQEKIYANIATLAESGAVGINIEDSKICNSKRSLRNASEFAGLVAYLKNKLHSHRQELFINVRCDTYILNAESKHQETIDRVRTYENAGADGIFLPCISNEADIAEAVAATRLPLNVMVIPGLPDIERLNELGVRRVSMGPFMFQKVYTRIGALSQSIVSKKNFSSIIP